MSNNNKINVYNPEYWGIDVNKIKAIPNMLRDLLDRFEDCFKTKTHNKKALAFSYIHGLFCMKDKKRISKIAFNTEEDYQSLHHFITNSPWDGEKVFKLIQSEIASNDILHNGILTLDDTGIRKYGKLSCGVSRQWIGNIGKVDNGQVAVALGYYKDNNWALADCELYFPEEWFNEDYRKEWKKLNIHNKVFKTKHQIGFDLVKKAKKQGLPFDIVCCDSFYGRYSLLRKSIDYLDSKYFAEIPCDTCVYLNRPYVGIPSKPDCNNQYCLFPDISNDVLEVRELLDTADMKEQFVRDSERGSLTYKCFSKEVFTVDSNGYLMKELLVIIDMGDKIKYYLSNVSPDTDLSDLVYYASGRYFVERVFEDIKSNNGFSDLQAIKYSSWKHHTALCGLCLWFFTLMKFNFFSSSNYYTNLKDNFNLPSLPVISLSNFCELLLSVLPLSTLSIDRAITDVVNKLVRRSRSILSLSKSRLDKGFNET